jgi:hypothetical protein
LHQYSSNTHARCITIHIKQFLDVELSQHKHCGEELLQSEKSFFTLLALFELGFLLQELGHRLGDLGEVWDELVIISH